MRVNFRVNLGSRDAEKHALDFRACERGMERDVSDKTGQWLVGKGIATEVLREIPATELPSEIRAVPDVPEISADTKPARGAVKKSHPPQKDE